MTQRRRRRRARRGRFGRRAFLAGAGCAALAGAAMLLGRVLSGVCKALLFAPATFSIAAWATASFVTGLPGIIIQLVLLPSLVVALTKARLLRVRYA